MFEKSILCIDIGGGSTEFVVGKNGVVKLAVSLKLGHVNLTQTFVKNGIGLEEMRDYIRNAIDESRLVDKLKEFDGFEVGVGSSGTIRAIENVVFSGYGTELCQVNLEEYKRDWRFSRRELRSSVEKLCTEGDEELIRREGFFNRRSEFIVVGAVLLEEIFKALGIEEIEVSEYALAEGVIADSLAKAFDGLYDLNANARWRSVMRLATRLNGKKRMNHACHTLCQHRQRFYSCSVLIFPALLCLWSHVFMLVHQSLPLCFISRTRTQLQMPIQFLEILGHKEAERSFCSSISQSEPANTKENRSHPVVCLSHDSNAKTIGLQKIYSVT